MTTRNRVSLQILDTKTLSGIAQGNGQRAAGIYLPKNLTGTSLTFNSYTKDGKNEGVIGDGAAGAYTRTITDADTYLPLPKDIFDGCDGIQIISGTTQSGDSDPIIVVFV